MEEGNLIDVESGLQDAELTCAQTLSQPQYSACHDILDAIYQFGAYAVSVVEDCYAAIVGTFFGYGTASEGEAGGGSAQTVLDTTQEHELSSSELSTHAESRSRQFADWVSSLVHQAHEPQSSEASAHAEGHSHKSVDWESSLAQWRTRESNLDG
ncbi:hypothetical protein ACIS_00810 [Anaplasma centrale str. Israel]|uniref:Uncharacterized protein n=1 Tax=Anaplasma centrale (strain Israel) TaxID=574556 RepID=D1AS97_ANACI|nr:hypothetical protein [Anaplasma centrale]ACZ49350.1 hypothetical protein ACIS_00810 [Anaplasma centrale str. Israel]